MSFARLKGKRFFESECHTEKESTSTSVTQLYSSDVKLHVLVLDGNSRTPMKEVTNPNPSIYPHRSAPVGGGLDVTGP